MNKVGIKLFEILDYELFERLQYWLDYDFEYDELKEHIESNQVITLELEEDEDREEDIEMLQNFLEKFKQKNIAFETFVMEDEWCRVELTHIT